MCLYGQLYNYCNLSLKTHHMYIWYYLNYPQ